MDQDTFEFMRDFIADYTAVLGGGRFADGVFSINNPDKSQRLLYRCMHDRTAR